MALTPAASVAIVVVIVLTLVTAIAWYFHSQVTVFARILLGIRREADEEEQLGVVEGQEEQEEQQSDERPSAGTQTTLA